MSLSTVAPAGQALAVLSRFRVEFFESLYARADELFELTDAVLCVDGPVKTLVELSLAAEHRRGHGALYAALDHGWAEPTRLRRAGGCQLECVRWGMTSCWSGSGGGYCRWSSSGLV
ncbi:transposase, partial [Streptomyces sp. NPDC005055]